MDLNLQNKVVVIAGGSKGIGKSITQGFIDEGAKVAICGRSEKALQEIEQLLQEKKEFLFSQSIDVRNKHSYLLWLKNILEKWGKIDIFIWNISAQSLSWEKNFQTDIQACVSCTEEIIPYLKKSDSPAIVITASEAASRGIPSFKAYPAMKAAIIHYMSSLATELIADNIRVNCVSPSEIYSEDGIWARMELDNPERYERALKRTASGRMANPVEIANAVIFLSSSRASYISGINLIIDAGAHQYVDF